MPSGPGHSRHLLKARSNPGLLSIVIPAYNEEAAISPLRSALEQFVKTLNIPLEIVIVNDGSTDSTIDRLMDWAAADPTLKVYNFARNFGHQAAVTAGLDLARGEAVVILDADLQDPLEAIIPMLEKYRQGYDVVYGQRISRLGESALKRFSAWLFYRLMRRFVFAELPPDTGDFRLISRPCLSAVRSMRETHRFLRGMTAWVGYAQTAVPYHRHKRSAGATKYTWLKMLRFGWEAAISFSPAPLRLSLAGGICIGLFGLGYGVYALARTIWVHDTIKGWASEIIISCVIGGAILISIGILGEYIGRIFEQSKNRPLYIISSSANAEPATPEIKA